MNHPDIHTELPFNVLTTTLDKIRSTRTQKNEKAKYLKGYLEAFKDAQDKFIAKHGNQSYTSFFPILRLLIPSKDKLRSYGMKETALARLYVTGLGLGEQSSDAGILKRGLNESDADFGDAVYVVMRDRCKESSTCKISDVNNFLDNLSDGDITQGKLAFAKIFTKLSAIDHKWLCRIILKSLKLGVSDNIILSVYHTDAPDILNRFNSLEKTCEIIESNKEITEELMSSVTVEPMVPIRPQLCNRLSEKQINEMMGQQEMFAETKMDGERIQLHRKGNDYCYFTRHGNDCSTQFGVNNFSGCFTSQIHHVFKIPLTDLILDGEMMVWDKVELRFVVKGENVSARTMKNHEKYQACYVVYDILFLNGESFIHKPYSDRISVLNSLFDDKQGILMKVKRTKVRSLNQVLEVLNSAIDDQEEGIVLKQINSVYSPGQRGAGWFKVKPDYLGNLITDIDLVVIGASLRKGQEFVHKYYVAVKDESGPATKFITVSPIVNNLSREDSKSVSDVLNPVMKPYVITSAPAFLDFGVYKPDVYIEPTQSIILQIKASELQKSSSVSTGYILRFPRVTAIRKDKPPTDCCDIFEYKSLYDLNNKGSNKVVKLPKRHATASDLMNPHKRASKRQKINTVPFSYVNRYKSVSDVATIDEIANGLEIAILSSGKGFPPKEELEVLVRKHGGKVVANPGRETNFCVAHVETPIVRSIIQNRSHTVVNVTWFLKAFPDSSAQKELLDITRKDTICMTPEFETKLKYKYDSYNDHFTKELSHDELQHQLNEMEHLFALLRNECNDVEKVIFGRDEIYNIYRGVTAYFDTQLFTSIDYKVAKLNFVARSGVLAGSLEDENHRIRIVIDEKDVQKVEVLKSWIKDMDKSIEFIDYKYYLNIKKN